MWDGRLKEFGAKVVIKVSQLLRQSAPMFESLIAAVQSDSAGDLFLYFSAFVFFSTLIVRYGIQHWMSCLHCIALLHIHSCVQADPPSQSSAQQRCQQTHCGPPLTTIIAFDWPSGISQTLAWPHFLETHVHTLRPIQRILCSEARARAVHRVLFACCRQRCFFWIR